MRRILSLPSALVFPARAMDLVLAGVDVRMNLVIEIIEDLGRVAGIRVVGATFRPWAG